MTNLKPPKELNQYDIAEWIHWLYSFIRKEECYPSLPTGAAETNESLEWLHGKLKGKPRVLFRLAVVDLFQSVAEGTIDERVLFYLLEVMDITVPVEHRAVIKKYILLEKLIDLEYNDIDLHVKLIDLYIRLIDFQQETSGSPGIEDYILRVSKRKNSNFRYNIVGIRLFYPVSTEKAFKILEYGIPKVNDDEQTRQNFNLVIREMTNEFGFKEFFHWYVNRYQILAKKYKSQFTVIVEDLKAWLSPWHERVQEDPYSLILGAYLHHKDFPFPAKLLYLIGETYSDLIDNSAKSFVEKLLEEIWVNGINHQKWFKKSSFLPAGYRHSPWIISNMPIESLFLLTNCQEKELPEQLKKYKQMIQFGNLNDPGERSIYFLLSNEARTRTNQQLKTIQTDEKFEVSIHTEVERKTILAVTIDESQPN